MKVLVTGANGHLGTNLVSALLAGGHAVRASVRSLDDRSKVAHVAALGPVEIVAASLEDEGSLRAAMDGVDAVVHAAAIYELFAPGREQQILHASIDGVAAALRAARDAGVKRMVLTSSVVTLPLPRPGEPAVDEASWASDLRVPYIRAKTMAERRAWELAPELGIELTTVLPGAFGGPGFQRPTPTIDLIAGIVAGALRLAAPPLNYPYVDVRDVARAHVLALEAGRCGRFIATNDKQPGIAEIARMLHRIDPRIPAPMVTLPRFTTRLLPWLDALSARLDGTPRSITPDMAATLDGKVWNVSNARIKRELGWSPQISIEQSLRDTVAALREIAQRTRMRSEALAT